jgi:hypothetical protein
MTIIGQDYTDRAIEQVSVSLDMADRYLSSMMASTADGEGSARRPEQGDTFDLPVNKPFRRSSSVPLVQFSAARSCSSTSFDLPVNKPFRRSSSVPLVQFSAARSCSSTVAYSCASSECSDDQFAMDCPVVTRRKSSADQHKSIGARILRRLKKLAV